MFPELITTPESYFQERVKYPTLRPQALIVVIAGFVANVWYLSLFNRIGAAAVYVRDVLYIMPFAGVLEFLIVWLVFTALMHFLALMVGGDSSFGQLLRLTGYGFLPMIVGGAIWSLGYYLAVAGATPPEPPVVPSFAARYEVFTAYMAPSYSDPVLIGALVLGSAFVLGSAYLWGQAISVVSGLDRDRSFAIAAGVGMIYVVRVLLPVL